MGRCKHLHWLRVLLLYVQFSTLFMRFIEIGSFTGILAPILYVSSSRHKNQLTMLKTCNSPSVHEYVVCEVHAVSIDASNIQREGSEHELRQDLLAHVVRQPNEVLRRSKNLEPRFNYQPRKVPRIQSPIPLVSERYVSHIETQLQFECSLEQHSPYRTGA